MAVTIVNPARFNDDGLGTRRFIRAAFFDEGYGVSTSFKAYAQGAGIVPATAAFDGIGAGTAGDPLKMSQFNGFTVPSLATVAISDLQLYASVGDVFNGQGYTGLTFNTNGTLSYQLYVLNSGTGRNVTISQDATTIATNSLSLTGNVSGMWKLSGNASDYQIFISKSGTFTSITGATNNTWTNMGTGAITLYVNTSVNDALDQQFNITIRSASTSTVLDSAVMTMDVYAAGIN
jgi:hypothetical protein